MRTRQSGIFNIAGPELTSIREIGEIAGSLLGKSPVFANADGTPNHLIADIAKMKSSLVAPQIGVRQGLKELCDIA